MKKFYSFVAFVMIIMLLSGCCYKSWMGKRPCDQPNSKWISENKQITFSINESGSGTGIIVNGDEIINIHVGIGPATEIDIFPLENVINNVVTGKYVEHWIGVFNKPNEFTATVKETTYFNIGDKITFHRVDDATNVFFENFSTDMD